MRGPSTIIHEIATCLDHQCGMWQEHPFAVLYSAQQLGSGAWRAHGTARRQKRSVRRRGDPHEESPSAATTTAAAAAAALVRCDIHLTSAVAAARATTAGLLLPYATAYTHVDAHSMLALDGLLGTEADLATTHRRRKPFLPCHRGQRLHVPGERFLYLSSETNYNYCEIKASEEDFTEILQPLSYRVVQRVFADPGTKMLLPYGS